MRELVDATGRGAADLDPRLLQVLDRDGACGARQWRRRTRLAPGGLGGGCATTGPGAGARLVLSADRFWPQHGMFLTSSQTLEEAGRPRQREPQRHGLPRPPRRREGERRGDPEAQALEAVHQLAGPALAEPRASTHDHVARPVLVREQVRDPPGRQRGDAEANAERRRSSDDVPSLALLLECRCRCRPPTAATTRGGSRRPSRRSTSCPARRARTCTRSTRRGRA